MGHIGIDLDPLRYEELLADIESCARSILQRHRDIDPRERVDANLRAEALHSLVHAAASDPEVGSPRPVGLTFVVDPVTIATGRTHAGSITETFGGTHVPLGVLARHACDCITDAIHLDPNGTPFDLGRTRRSASPAQRKALRALYGACPVSGTPFRDCEIHHLEFWEHDGPTDLDNLVPISRRWHHLVHDQKWTLVRTDDGGLELRRPDGDLHRRIPPPVPITRSVLDDEPSSFPAIAA
jgi:hypothetical protein